MGYRKIILDNCPGIGYTDHIMMKETAMINQKTSPSPRVVYVTFAMIISKDADIFEVVSKVEPTRRHITAKHPSIMGTELVKVDCDEA
jgi:hypothetical protein